MIILLLLALFGPFLVLPALIYFDNKYLIKNTGFPFLTRGLIISVATALRTSIFLKLVLKQNTDIGPYSDVFKYIFLSAAAGWIFISFCSAINKVAIKKKLTLHDAYQSLFYLFFTFLVAMCTIGLTLLGGIACTNSGGC